MVRLTPTLFAIVIAVPLLGVQAGASAQQDRGRGDRERAPEAQSQGSLSDSVRRIARDRRGQVLSAERVPFDGREVHRVKVLDDRGRVRVYMDDPQHRDRGDHDDGDNDGRSRRPPTRDDDD